MKKHTETFIPLHRQLFTQQAPTTLLSSDEWTVTAKTYPSGIESLTLANSRGYVEVLPFMGQMVWDAVFDGTSLRMGNMFTQPQKTSFIQETYGCFAFHAGLLANGCPAPEDAHPLHGEFPCAPMDSAELILSEDGITVRSHYEYVLGFGHHYRAVPTLTLHAGSGIFDIGLEVTNLSSYQKMPLQYMCHMNYVFVPGATMSDNLTDGSSFQLRRTVPAHVTPTPEWEEINRKIIAGEFNASSLDGAEAFDPEIVYFADDLGPVNTAEFFMHHPDGSAFVTRFSPQQFPTATRWILHNPDQKVAAFALPATCRPEGFLAAQASGMLIELEPGATRSFTVETGLLNATEWKEQAS